MEERLKKPVKQFMTKEVITVKEDDLIKKVFKVMDEEKILGVPVVNEEKHPVGIVTETDLICHFTTLESPRTINLLGSLVYLDDVNTFNESLKDHCAETVKDIMTEKPVTISETASLTDAIDLMAENHITRLPVVNENNELTGIITRTDIVHQLAKIKKI